MMVLGLFSEREQIGGASGRRQRRRERDRCGRCRRRRRRHDRDGLLTPKQLLSGAGLTNRRTSGLTVKWIRLSVQTVRRIKTQRKLHSRHFCCCCSVCFCFVLFSCLLDFTIIQFSFFISNFLFQSVSLSSFFSYFSLFVHDVSFYFNSGEIFFSLKPFFLLVREKNSKFQHNFFFKLWWARFLSFFMYVLALFFRVFDS